MTDSLMIRTGKTLNHCFLTCIHVVHVHLLKFYLPTLLCMMYDCFFCGQFLFDTCTVHVIAKTTVTG